MLLGVVAGLGWLVLFRVYRRDKHQVKDVRVTDSLATVTMRRSEGDLAPCACLSDQMWTEAYRMRASPPDSDYWRGKHGVFLVTSTGPLAVETRPVSQREECSASGMSGLKSLEV